MHQFIFPGDSFMRKGRTVRIDHGPVAVYEDMLKWLADKIDDSVGEDGLIGLVAIGRIDGRQARAEARFSPALVSDVAVGPAALQSLMQNMFDKLAKK